MPAPLPIKNCGARRPPAKDCQCYRCIHWRSYAREWWRDQKRLGTKNYDRIKRTNQAWRKRNALHAALYRDLRYLAVRDGSLPRRGLERRICDPCGAEFFVEPRARDRSCSWECRCARRAALAGGDRRAAVG